MPAWLIFLLAGALVFGVFYLYRGAQAFLQTGGLGVQEATERAQIVSSATANRVTQASGAERTLPPSNTPIPECTDFRVVVENAIVREQPALNAPIIDGLGFGTVVCVIGREGESEWYLIDRNPDTRRIERAYMNEIVIEPVNPSPTPSRTYTPLPTVTEAPTQTPSATFTASATSEATRSRAGGAAGGPNLTRTAQAGDIPPSGTPSPHATATHTVDPNAQPTLPPPASGG